MVHRGLGFQEQMIDALVFSLAVYETCPEKVLSVLRYKYDLPVGALDLLNIEGIISHGIPSETAGQPTRQPILVGRSTHGHVVVACRGTADFSDLIQDLKIIPKWLRGSSTGAAAHMGFVERAESVDIQPFLQLLSRGEKLVFTGHSLGGAVSSLLALRVLEAAEDLNVCTHLGQVQCVTFGSPLFASPSLANCINEKYNDRFCHVVSKHDLVPRLVPLVRMGMRLSGCGTGDVAEGFRIVRFCLEAVENITSFPVASAIRTAESVIPQPIRSFVGNAIRLFWPRKTSQQYAFAGKFLFVDPLAQQEEEAVSMATGDDLNAFSSELAFALGLNVNVLEHHGLSAYQQGLVKGFKSRLMAHFHRKKRQATEVPEARYAGGEAGDLERWGLLGSQPPAGTFPFHGASPKTSRHRHSVDYGRLHPGGGMAAVAMEAASVGYRTAKLTRLRSSMERNIAGCAATLAVLAEHSVPDETGCSDRGVDGGACPDGPRAPKASRLSLQNVQRRLDMGAGEAQELTGSSPEPACCHQCRVKRIQAAHSPSHDRTSGLMKHCSTIDEKKSTQLPKGRFHFGWIFKTILTITQFARSLNTFTVTCCAVRFLLGSPLF